jgi:hypothetical protein
MITIEPVPFEPLSFEFVRAVFKVGGREYTYKAKPDTLVVGDEALAPNGKTLMITAVKCEGVIANGLPLGDAFYGWVEKKVEKIALEGASDNGS